MQAKTWNCVCFFPVILLEKNIKACKTWHCLSVTFLEHFQMETLLKQVKEEEKK